MNIYSLKSLLWKSKQGEEVEERELIHVNPLFVVLIKYLIPCLIAYLVFNFKMTFSGLIGTGLGLLLFLMITSSIKVSKTVFKITVLSAFIALLAILTIPYFFEIGITHTTANSILSYTIETIIFMIIVTLILNDLLNNDYRNYYKKNGVYYKLDSYKEFGFKAILNKILFVITLIVSLLLIGAGGVLKLQIEANQKIIKQEMQKKKVAKKSTKREEMKLKKLDKRAEEINITKIHRLKGFDVVDYAVIEIRNGVKYQKINRAGRALSKVKIYKSKTLTKKVWIDSDGYACAVWNEKSKKPSFYKFVSQRIR
jgi:hypothetical protein